MNQQKSGNTRLYAVVMAGGRGERFWPVSRAARPKQFLPLISDVPMVVETVNRLSRLVNTDNIIVVSGTAHRDTLTELFPDLSKQGNLIFEPEGRDTAGCIALAAGLVSARCKDALMGLFPADHSIGMMEEFRRSLTAGVCAADMGFLVTIGIKADRPLPSYGYIQQGTAVENMPGVFRVKRFTEKPDRETARGFIASGDYSWNSGIFLWRADSIAEEMKRYMPAHYEAFRSFELDFAKKGTFDKRCFLNLPKISIDYGIMEKTDKAVVIPARFGWDDLGTWEAVAKYLDPDTGGNKLKGLGLVENGAGNVIYNTEQGKIVAVLDTEDIVVVNTPDALLVLPRTSADRVKSIVRTLEQGGYDTFL